MGILFETGIKTEQETMLQYKAELEPLKESNDFFAIIKSFYNDDEYAKFTKNEKDKMSFMVNRRMSIMHPLESAYLSRTGIEGYAIVDFWKDAITSKYKTYPGWLYTKTTPQTKDKNEEKFKRFSSEIIEKCLDWHDIERKTLDEMFRRYPSDVIKELEKIEKLLTKSIVKGK